MKKVTFFFDFLSPYSYFAWSEIKNLDWDIEFIPVSVASLVAHYETKGPAQIEPKRNYLFKDLLRKSKMLNIPFSLPKSLPFNSLYALRLSLDFVSLDKQRRIVDAVFTAGWIDGLEIGNDDDLKNILKEKNLYSDDLFNKMESKEARIGVKKNIENALSLGVFGVPTFIYKDELFWGHDSLTFLKMALEDQDPLDQKIYQQYKEHFQSR